MLIQTEQTPNPNTLKFLPGKKVSEIGPVEFTKKNNSTNISLVNEILSLDGIEMIFFGEDFITVKKGEKFSWNEIKHNVIARINDYYLKGHKVIIKKNKDSKGKNTTETSEVIIKINQVLDTKIRPAVARDGGDIKFRSFKNGIVQVELQGSCSGCPSSIMTLKQGVQNLLCHYVPEVKGVEAI
mgnify:CR=1 FL=1